MNTSFQSLSLIDKAKFIEDFISKFEPITLIHAVAFIDSFENFKSENSDVTGMSFMIPEYISLLILKKHYPTIEEVNAAFVGVVTNKSQSLSQTKSLF